MTFLEALGSCFRKYFTVKGRAPRSEYWYFQLFILLVDSALSVLASQIESPPVAEGVEMLTLVFVNLTWIPTITAAARRLHDSGRSGWLQLLSLTIIAIPLVLYWLIRKGDPGPNAYGDPVLPPADEPSSTKSPVSTPETPPTSSSATQLESRDGVNMASDLRDTTK